MKSEWTYRPLGELVSFASGGTPSKKRDDYWGGTIPWISAKTCLLYTSPSPRDTR